MAAGTMQRAGFAGQLFSGCARIRRFEVFAAFDSVKLPPPASRLSPGGLMLLRNGTADRFAPSSAAGSASIGAACAEPFEKSRECCDGDSKSHDHPDRSARTRIRYHGRPCSNACQEGYGPPEFVESTGAVVATHARLPFLTPI
jgi:hypothetical protein